MKNYDLVIIGSGPAGLEVNYMLGASGKTVCFIEKSEKQPIEKSAGWHKELLNNAARGMDIISSESRDILVEYMQFRHFFRHAYNFQMNWQKMEHLALGIPGTG